MRTKTRQQKIALILGIILACMLFTTAAWADRPISDWLSSQGQDPTQWGGSLFIPPDKNFLGWADHFYTIFASVDYAGLANAYPPLSPKPVFSPSSTVTETLLADGRAQVTVHLVTKNANAWAMRYPGDFATSPTIFGNRPADVLNGAVQALATTSLDLIFNNPNPGLNAALPDLVWLVGNYNDPTYLPVPEVDYISFSFDAQSVQPSLGKLTIYQAGIWEGGAWNWSSEVVVVPLPATLLLFGSSLLGLLGIRSSRRS